MPDLRCKAVSTLRDTHVARVLSRDGDGRNEGVEIFEYIEAALPRTTRLCQGQSITQAINMMNYRESRRPSTYALALFMN
jgi:hypothetical protein